MAVEGVDFHKARDSGAANCVEVGFPTQRDGRPVWAYVRNSHDRDWTVLVPFYHWLELVDEAQVTGKVDLAKWFPEDRYGRFAASFTEAEREAFEAGILTGQPELVGLAAA
jgi:hypothetical protein